MGEELSVGSVPETGLPSPDNLSTDALPTALDVMEAPDTAGASFVEQPDGGDQAIGHRIPQLTVRRVALLIGLALSTVAALLILGDGAEAFDALLQVNLWTIALAMVVHYSGFAVRGHRWQRLLRVMGYPLGYLFVTGLLLAGWFVSALLPARSGDILRIAVLRVPGDGRQPVPVADGLGSIVLERALDIVAILILGAAFTLWVASDRLPQWVTFTYAAGIVVLLLLGTVIVVAPPLLEWLSRLSSNRYWSALIAFGQQFASSLQSLFRQPKTALLLLGESLYIWLCDVALLWLAVASLGGSIAIAEAGFVALTVDVVAAIPLTPGGIGQIETAYAALLTMVAGSSLSVAAVILITRLVSYWSFLLFTGVVTFAAGFGAMLTGTKAGTTSGPPPVVEDKKTFRVP